MDISEINKLVEDYGKDIYSFCKKLTYNEDDAEELYQDTFLKVMDVADRIDAENNPKSYLISVCISLWNNKKRKYARRNNQPSCHTSHAVVGGCDCPSVIQPRRNSGCRFHRGFHAEVSIKSAARR